MCKAQSHLAPIQCPFLTSLPRKSRIISEWKVWKFNLAGRCEIPELMCGF